MSGVSHPLAKAIQVCLDSLRKTQQAIEKNKSVESCSNKVLRLTRRFYDVSKLFLHTYESGTDVVSTKLMLYVARSCLMVSHVLQHHFKLQQRTKTKPFLNKMKTHVTLVRNTLGRDRYPFLNSEEEYAKHKIGQVLHPESSKRKFYDELSNCSIALKLIANRLVDKVQKSVVMMVIKPPYGDDYAGVDPLTLMGHSIVDLEVAYNTMVHYSEKLEQSTVAEEAVLAMCTQYGEVNGRIVASREQRRSRQHLPRIVDVHDTLTDLQRISKMLSTLPTLIDDVTNEATEAVVP